MGSDTVVGFASAPLEIIDGDRGTNYPKQSDFSLSGDCLFLNTGNVTSNGFDFTQLNFISREKDQQLRKGKAKRYDVILTTRGTVGNVSYYDQSVPFEDIRINSGMVLLRADRRKLWPQYLYYFVRSSLFGTQVASLSTGSAQPQLPIRDINRVKIRIPSLDEQRAIAAVLGALDDKIELNRRMNGTLEAMARALFKSWFVDFDPVRAKMEGRPTGLPGEIEALFVGEMEEGRPLGWGVGTLGDICDYIMSGGTPRTTQSEFWDGEIPWLSSGETRQRFIIDTEKTITQLGVERSSTRLARAHSTVIAGAGQGHTRGQTSLLLFDSYINQSVVALAANKSVSSDLFVFLSLVPRYEEFRQLSDSHSSRGSLTTRLLATVPIIKPPIELIQHFDNVVGPMVKRIKTNLNEAKTLTALRDGLLPKLMSGEVRVPLAEEVVADAL